MTIVYIVIMAVGLLAFIASFFMPDAKENTSEVSFKPAGAKASFDYDEQTGETVKEETTATDAIEAAKKKAKEAVNKDYQFDLHLTKDSSNQTVEELERDLLGGLDLSESAEAVEESIEIEKPVTASNSSKGSSKKKNRKKNAPKNDRYDDLLYEDTQESAKEAADAAVSAVKTQTSKNNKKGKKK